MSIRCKFKLDEITKTATQGATIKMSPVYGDNPENKSFFKWTPSGVLEFRTINEEAIAGLELGGEYYIDITPAAK